MGLMGTGQLSEDVAQNLDSSGVAPNQLLSADPTGISRYGDASTRVSVSHVPQP